MITPIRIFGFLIGYGMVYMSFAFGAWNFNPGEWSELTRWMCVYIGIVAGGMLAILGRDIA